MEELTLEKKLKTISTFFDLNSIVNGKFNEKEIIKYYVASNLGYSRIHSEHGSIHMALNYDGVFDKEGYYEHAKIVNNYINNENVSNVLEIASGKGFNLSFLAKENPRVNFQGIDLTPKHVKYANKKNKISNTKYKIANFMDIPFPNESFDLSFEIESICHATNMKKALSEIHRVLKPNSNFIVFDGFRTPVLSKLDSNFKLASRLIEASMAIDKAWIIDDWRKLAIDVGFKIIDEKDLSTAILPNLKRLEHYASRFFKNSIKSKIAKFILPSYLIKNAIAGYLMPNLINEKVHIYSQIVLRKN